ncbi:MAG: hypothetical protein IK078_03505 [Lachnospiraceae bacterium]|nr:hypothetical protein [Lachnospiraceae bacterium]
MANENDYPENTMATTAVSDQSMHIDRHTLKIIAKSQQKNNDGTFDFHPVFVLICTLIKKPLLCRRKFYDIMIYVIASWQMHPKRCNGDKKAASAKTTHQSILNWEGNCYESSIGKVHRGDTGY